MDRIAINILQLKHTSTIYEYIVYERVRLAQFDKTFNGTNRPADSPFANVY